MRQSVHNAPREYQIAELTRGIPLPMPALNRRHIKVITEFFVEAWSGLLRIHEQILRTKEEKEINTLMSSRLNRIRGDKPEWLMVIAEVTRGSESLSYDGSHLEKRPDILVQITNRPSGFPLIVECKLIDKNTGKGVNLYCNNGISRFINGEYSWYAHESFMLAYVRDGSTISTCLTPHLDKGMKNNPDPFLTEHIPQTDGLSAQDLAISRHGRQFSGNPGPIAIWHLWLS